MPSPRAELPVRRCSSRGTPDPQGALPPPGGDRSQPSRQERALAGVPQTPFDVPFWSGQRWAGRRSGSGPELGLKKRQRRLGDRWPVPQMTSRHSPDI